MSTLPRTSTLPEDVFVDEHLTPGLPLLVTGEVPLWPAYQRWTWSYLTGILGHYEVEVFDDFFVPTGSTTFADFVAQNVGDTDRTSRRRYVRWFARNRDSDGLWADEALGRLSDDWRHPSFLPTTGYTVPPVRPPARTDATRDPFPYRALLVSAVGARTRLHLDPWTSGALLCQVRGRKHVQMWAPEWHRTMLRLAGDPDRDAALAAVPPTYEDDLEGGAIVFIPGGWWHQVDTVSDSVSLTWNFVHERSAPAYEAHRRAFPDDPELAVADHFLRHVPPRTIAG
ncbi:MAG TPA: cupin-like domain-containing protein, partial [Kineosporiaceae bacterium]|jgi:hypothetical protein|nr:cupin-like domain-containing protein [Kineosporiaceae bacterium]